MRDAARKLIEAYKVKTPGPDAAIKGLSGGNVQRAVLARELHVFIEALVVREFGETVADFRLALGDVRLDVLGRVLQ